MTFGDNVYVPAPGPYYVADFAVDRRRDRLWYVGGIENGIDGYDHRNPVIGLDWRTGEKRVLGRLADWMAGRKLPRFRWCFGALVARDGRHLYLCADAAGDTVWLVRVRMQHD